MARIDKKFVLSTSQLNSHKFRCLTEGAEIADFIANPIMYWLHKTPNDKEDAKMPIGFWEDIKIEGDDITAYPNINDSDAFALSIGKMVEHGTIRSASIEADPIELDTDKNNWLPGQKLPTLKRYSIGEASLADRGSNKGALVRLCHNGKTIKLSDQADADAFFLTLQKPKEDTMKITLNEKTATHLKLSANTELDATEVVEKLVDLVEAKDAEVVQLKKDAVTGKITLMVNKAIDDRKILAGQKDDFIKLAEGNFEGTEKILNGMAPTGTLESRLNLESGENADEIKRLRALSYDELFKSDGLIRLKKLDLESFKLKHKEKYNKDWVEPTRV